MPTIRARLTAGLLHKAERGDLALALPLGLVREAVGKVHKTPDREVPQRIALLFATFLRVHTASTVTQFFKEQHLTIPGRDRFGDLAWKAPTISAITAVLNNPAYAGAVVYGKSRTVRQASAPGKAAQTQRPLEAWKLHVNDKYPAYIPWEPYVKIRARLQENYAEYERHKTRGVPRAGAALLHGLLYGGECGHQMMVQYQGGTRSLCNARRQKYGVPVGQKIPADWVDAAVVAAFFQARSPIALAVSARAVAAPRHTDEQPERARQQPLARRRYQAALAQRHDPRGDPDHRLGAAEREARWEAA